MQPSSEVDDVCNEFSSLLKKRAQRRFWAVGLLKRAESTCNGNLKMRWSF